VILLNYKTACAASKNNGNVVRKIPNIFSAAFRSFHYNFLFIKHMTQDKGKEKLFKQQQV